MIYVGYQAVGKTTYCRANRETNIDLESSSFEKRDGWANDYISVALNLEKQGFNVFVSSHKAVRERLFELGVKYVVILPAPNMESIWLKRLESRIKYSFEPLEKDVRAFENAKKGFTEQIADLFQDEGCSFILLDNDNPFFKEELLKDYIKQSKEKIDSLYGQIKVLDNFAYTNLSTSTKRFDATKTSNLNSVSFDINKAIIDKQIYVNKEDK